MSMYKDYVTSYNGFTNLCETREVVFYPERSIRYTPDEKYIFDEEFKSFSANGLFYRRELDQLFNEWHYFCNDVEISELNYRLDMYFTMIVLGYDNITARKFLQ